MTRATRDGRLRLTKLTEAGRRAPGSALVLARLARLSAGQAAAGWVEVPLSGERPLLILGERDRTSAISTARSCTNSSHACIPPPGSARHSAGGLPPAAPPRSGPAMHVADPDQTSAPYRHTDRDTCASADLGSAPSRRATRARNSSSVVDHSAAAIPRAVAATWNGPYGPGRVATPGTCSTTCPSLRGSTG